MDTKDKTTETRKHWPYPVFNNKTKGIPPEKRIGWKWQGNLKNFQPQKHISIYHVNFAALAMLIQTRIFIFWHDKINTKKECGQP